MKNQADFMEEKPCAPRDLLLRYLGGDEEKLERYLRFLAACASAFEVADRVVRRVYVEENIPHEVFTKESFYGLFAALAPEMKNGSLKPKTLYYHIAKHLPEWREERGKRRKEMPRNYERAYVPQRFSRDKEVDAIIHLHSDAIPEEILRNVEYCIEKGWATLYEPAKNEKMCYREPSFSGNSRMVRYQARHGSQVALMFGKHAEKVALPAGVKKTIVLQGVPAPQLSQMVRKLRHESAERQRKAGMYPRKPLLRYRWRPDASRGGRPLVVVNVW